MKYLITLFLLCLSPTARADFHLLEVDRVSVEHFRILNHRDPYWDYIPETTGETWSQGGAFNLNLNLIRWDWFQLSWDNRLHMESTEAQIRGAGWEFTVAVSLADKINLYYKHHSQHLLDAVPDPSNREYPLLDQYGVELVLWQR